MSEMKRLLDLAERRNRAGSFTSARVKILKTDFELLRKQLADDGLSLNQMFMAVVRGYLLRHPSVLAMLDDLARDRAKPELRKPSLSNKEMDEIYATIGSGMMDTDEEVALCHSCQQPMGKFACDICDDLEDQ